MSERLPERQGEAIRRERPVSFRFERRRIQAFEGDTVGSALAAAGVTITARSVTYHRPRGLLCMTGSCPNCLMQVDDVPNVRACIEPVREGMRVERQHAWPSVDHDLGGWRNTLSFIGPPDSPHRILRRRRWTWPLTEPSARSKAALGTVPREADHGPRERIDLHPDVLVIGAGAAGLAAAAEAAEAGAAVIVLDQRREAGGHLVVAADTVRLAGLVRRAQDAGARILLDTAAFGIFAGLLVAAASSDMIYRIRARRVILATGAEEQLAVFAHNDLPGVMLSSAVERLIGRYGVLPGRRAVVLTTDNGGYTTAWTLKDAGAQVTVVDLRAEGGWPEGFPVIAGSTIVSAHGRRKVTGVTIGPPGARSGQKVSCDLVAIAGLVAPSTNLLAQAGARLELDDASQAYLPVGMPERTHAAGALTGARSVEAAIAQGRIAGREAAAALGLGERMMDLDALGAVATSAGDPVTLPPEVAAVSGKQFACLCMDVTSKEIETAVAEGFDSMELLKRATALTMGPCQGKSCMSSSQRLCARATGRGLAGTPPTTARPPSVPVEVRTLAGARRTPRKETAMHDRHVAAGAEIVWDGRWRRPRRYTDADAEVEAVRNRVGLIDVSPVGSFRIQGPQAVELLERLYPRRCADLAIGRIRYGTLLDEAGAILDDGVIVRIADDEFFVTVSNEDADAIERWITWWTVDWRLDVRIVNVTGAFGAVNLAGPRSREVMAAVTDADASAEAMPYLSATRAVVADVPALVLRIGFVGELGYEIHFPSMYGEHLWDAILEAGEPYGIAPFGLEAQRILRLEKQHILIGQDTDARSDPFAVGLGWMVEDDGPDFLGLRALRELKTDGGRTRLVGFTAPDDWLPPEGASVVHEGRRVGRVTSARRSPAAGSVIGLAWVPATWASEGTTFAIEFGASHATGTVRTSPFHDPGGERLRS